jgi:dihydroxy-acid dehydratase
MAPGVDGGLHPNCGLHPNREVRVRESRRAERSGFRLQNRYRPNTNKAF